MSVNYQSLKEKMVSSFKDYLLLGEQKGYFILDKGKIKYSAVGKSYNFSNPEEKVRMMYYFDLIEKYNYPPDKIEFEISVPDRTPDRYADIVVFTNDAQRKPYIVAECKKDGISDAEFEQAVKQVIASARLLKAPYAICVAGNTRRAIEVEKWNDKKPERAAITDIPISYNRVEEFRHKKGRRAKGNN